MFGLLVWPFLAIKPVSKESICFALSTNIKIMFGKRHLEYEKCQSLFFEYSQEPKTRGYQFLAVHFIQECN